MSWIDRLIETEDRMVAEAVARERARNLAAFDAAMREAWQMVDPLNPSGQPGSYARGEHNGIVAALQAVRQNFNRTAGVNGYTEGRSPQHVLKAEGASPDATDRGNCANASPGGGPMGVGQAAAAAPAGVKGEGNG